MPTKVDFYLLAENSITDGRLFICRLIEKIYKQQLKCYIYVASKETLQLIDDSLWTFKDVSFVPHHIVGAMQDDSAVVVGDVVPDKEYDVLVNLTNKAPDFYQNFSRVVEIVPDADDLKAAGRDKYKVYKQNQCELDTHKI